MVSKEESLISADLSFSCSLGQRLAWAYTRKSRDVRQSRIEEKDLQVDVVRIYQTSIAARPVHGIEYIQWEQMTAKPDSSRRRVAPDLTEHHYHGFF